MAYNIMKFPKNLARIETKEAFKNYCLKPYGYKVDFNS